MKDWIAISAFLISTGSLVISILNFQRNRKFDNENHLFKIKLDIYQSLLKEITSFLKSIDLKLQFLEAVSENPSQEDVNKLNLLADEIDAQVYELHYMIQANSLIIPTNVYNPLEEFSDSLFDGKNENEDNERLKMIVWGAFEKADEIKEEMRVDLNVKNLNISLFKRIS